MQIWEAIRIQFLQVTSILILLFMVCDSGLADPPETKSMISPRLLDDVYIGMSLKELKRNRPEVQRVDGLMFDPDNYFEVDGDTMFYDSVTYVFKWGKLKKIVFRKNTESLEYIHKLRPTFLKEAVSKLGTNFERFIRIQGSPGKFEHHLPAAVWKKPTQTIALVYTPGCELGGKEFDPSRNPIARFALYYFEMSIMANDHDFKKSLSAIDFLPASEVEGADCLFEGLESSINGQGNTL